MLPVLQVYRVFMRIAISFIKDSSGALDGQGFGIPGGVGGQGKIIEYLNVRIISKRP